VRGHVARTDRQPGGGGVRVIIKLILEKECERRLIGFNWLAFVNTIINLRVTHTHTHTHILWQYRRFLVVTTLFQLQNETEMWT
jgi:hypothetical protein